MEEQKMKASISEKLKKVISDIENTKSEIEKSKEKIKKLNELCSVLSDYGIKSVNDFQNFLEKYTSEVNTDENINGEN